MENGKLGVDGIEWLDRDDYETINKIAASAVETAIKNIAKQLAIYINKDGGIDVEFFLADDEETTREEFINLEFTDTGIIFSASMEDLKKKKELEDARDRMVDEEFSGKF